MAPSPRRRHFSLHPGGSYAAFLSFILIELLTLFAIIDVEENREYGLPSLEKDATGVPGVPAAAPPVSEKNETGSAADVAGDE